MKVGSDILNRLELLYLEIIPLVRSFPKDQKFTLGENIENALLTVVREFYSASYDKSSRESSLKQMRMSLHETVFLIRVSYKLKFIKESTYENLTKELIEIGKITSSWIKK